MNIFAPIGRVLLLFLAETGRLTLFTVNAVLSCVRFPIYWALIGQQMMRIGYFSLPVVGLTAFFTGGALALQIFVGSNRFGAESFVPNIVVLGITRGQHEYRSCSTARAQSWHQRIAVQPRQSDVKDDRVEFMGSSNLQAGLAIGSRHHRELTLVEPFA